METCCPTINFWIYRFCKNLGETQMQPKEFTGFCQHECCWFLSTSPNLTREELRRKWAKFDSVQLRHCRGGVFVPIEYEERQVLTCYQGLEVWPLGLPKIPSNKKLVWVFVLTVLRDIWCMVLRPRHLRVGLKGNPPFLNEDIFSLARTSFPRKLPKFSANEDLPTIRFCPGGNG